MSAMLLADRAPRGTLVPGKLSHKREVPRSIARPEYLFHDGPEVVTASDVKNEETIEKIRIAGRIAADAMYAAGAAIKPGVTTDELDRIAHEYMCDHGAYPSCLDYMEFPKSICTSINEVICHGIPDSTVVHEGDFINLDVTAYKDGVHGDTNAMFMVGDVDEESRLLAERTKNAMMRGIKAVKPGRQINVIGRVIESYAKRFEYGVVEDFTGHGVGEAFHSGLIVPHYDAAPNYATVIEPGMVFTIEPMLTLGDIAWEQWDDDWTVVTKDRSRTAQWEHTLVVTKDGAEILTLPTDVDLAPHL
ncbi:MAG: type I methionyl aminopeptidase [Ancrocorticia sp.]|uniref:type I methionyl aminopeptidase n=1 Tax=Ancrocorticia sp. TaxID=2593684 RepID=UPI003F8E073E